MEQAPNLARLRRKLFNGESLVTITTADEKKQQVLENVQSSIRLLSDIVIDRCWGYSDYNDAHKAFLHELLNQMIEQRRRLER